MADDLETIRKLIRLATDKSATDAESRTAALKACKLIVQKKVELSRPTDGLEWTREGEDSVVKERPSSPPSAKDVWDRAAEDTFSPDVAEAFGFGKARARARNRHAPPSHPEARGTRRAGRAHDPIPDPSRTVVTVHQDRYCGECGKLVKVQNQMAKRRGESDDVICMLCYALGKGYEEHQI